MSKQTVEHPDPADSMLPIAPILGATSDGRATAESARGLLITVLGEFVRSTGGAWTQTLIDAMVGLGVREKTTRQVLARLADRGWLERSRVGRRTRWSLTDTSQRLLDTGADRIYGFGRHDVTWDGRWLVLMASLGEHDQHHRYALTTGLTWAGFGSLGQGIWLSPWTDLEDRAVATLGELEIDSATTFVAQVGAMGSGESLAARAWDLDKTQAHYQQFLEFAASIDPGASEVDAVTNLALLVHQWRRFPFLDPELPPELLPTDWPGGLARARFDDLRAALLDAATTWWSTTDQSYGPAPS